MSCFRHFSPIMFDYMLHGVILTRVESKTDLGVILDRKLTFLPHIDYMINKANKMLGFVKRNTKDFTDPFAIKSLFHSLVRSILEYGCIIWDPFYRNSINRIEKVQKSFSRYLFF